MTTGQRMKLRRKELGMNAEEVARLLGVSPATVYRYEKGDIEKVPGDILEPLSKILNTTPAWLMGWDIPSNTLNINELSHKNTSIVENIISFDYFKQIPIIGTIACGEPILAEENHEGYTNVEIDVHADFALRCKGDSMSPKFSDGDIVLIRQQPDVENGQIAAVLIDNEATLKRVYKNPGNVLLSPENLSYQPMVYTGEDMNNIRILGLAIGFTRIF